MAIETETFLKRNRPHRPPDARDQYTILTLNHDILESNILDCPKIPSVAFFCRTFAHVFELQAGHTAFNYAYYAYVI